jgi:hypothetical protein
MENIQQIRKAHWKLTHEVTFKTTTKTLEDGSTHTTKKRIVKRVPGPSLKAFAKECSVRDGVDYNEVIKVAHRHASKSRSEAKKLKTRAATAANRLARRKGSNNKASSASVADVIPTKK